MHAGAFRPAFAASLTEPSSSGARYVVFLMYAAALAGGWCTVRLTLLKTNPIISFFVSKFPSPAMNFFAEIGSLPSLWCVNNVGGKTT